MAKPKDEGRALVRLAEAVRAYLDSDMVVSAGIALELWQALNAAEGIVRGQRHE